MNTRTEELSDDELDCVSGGDGVLNTVAKAFLAASEALGKAIDTISAVAGSGAGSGSGGGSGVAPKSTWL